MKKSVSIALIVLGAALFIGGRTLSHRAALGEARIGQAEEGGQRMPRVGPVRRNASREAAQTKQERLVQAERNISGSHTSALWLQGAGVVFFVIGCGGLAWRVVRARGSRH